MIFLIVDDDPCTAQVLKTMHKQSSIIDIFNSHNGLDAIATAVEKRPDIIFLNAAMPFLDFMTPELDGMQTLKMLKTHEHTKNIDVIMISENIEQQNLATMLDAGAIACISKPLKTDTLNEKLSNLYPDIF